jgi:endoglycosylceramidase
MLVAALTTIAAFVGLPARASALPALHASEDREIHDTHDRQVLLRGINVTSLTDQYQVNPRVPTVVPLRPRDYRKMETFGFNVIRLAVNWSKLEPDRGQINDAYIGRIAKVVHTAAEHGMYTVIDMHFSGWGKYVATPPAEVCPAGLEPAHGWYGAPEWATFTDGRTTCQDETITKRTEAVKAAWFNFWTNHTEPQWADGRGIQDHLVDVLGELARRFANAPTVAGYDILNEADPSDFEDDELGFYDGRFNASAIDAIREGEAGGGGFSHMIIFEPNLTWAQNGLNSHTPDPGFSDDPNLVFSPHIYGRDVHTTQRPISAVRRDLKRQIQRTGRRAREYGVPLWIGEWSFSHFDTDALKKLRAHTKLQDSHALGSAWWQWRVACGSPQTFDGLDPTPTRQTVGNINPTKCPSGRRVPLPGGWRSIIARAYPRYAPGTITDLRARGSRISLTGRSPCSAELRRSDPQACKLVVWVPKIKKHGSHHRHRRGGTGKGRPRIKGRHLRQVHMRKIPGGWVVTAKVGGGSYRLNTR